MNTLFRRNYGVIMSCLRWDAINAYQYEMPKPGLIMDTHDKIMDTHNSR